MNRSRMIHGLAVLVLAGGCEGQTNPPSDPVASTQALEEVVGEQVEVIEGAEIPVQGAFTPLDEVPSDLDGDGFVAEVDADDENPFVFPGAEEIPCSGVDEDGDTVDPCPPDVDGDGARSDADCDDLDPAVGPLALEITCDGRDQNCDGRDDCDRDEDGVLDEEDLDPDDPLVTVAPTEYRPLY